MKTEAKLMTTKKLIVAVVTMTMTMRLMMTLKPWSNKNRTATLSRELRL